MQARSSFTKARRFKAQRYLSISYSGFTLIELMVVIAIVAVLTALAAPSFNPIIERWRVRQSADGMQSSLYYARSEAIKRGGNVRLRKLPNGTDSCTLASGTNDWGCGWVVVANPGASEEVLQRFNTPRNMQVTRTSGGANIDFNRWGRINGTFVGFSLVPLNRTVSDSSARGLCMSSGGRVRVITDPPCTSG